MKIQNPKCPTCGHVAKGILESLYCLAGIACAEDGTAEYAGESEVFWDSQTPVDDPGGITLECVNDHRWTSPVDWADASAVRKGADGQPPKVC